MGTYVITRNGKRYKVTSSSQETAEKSLDMHLAPSGPPPGQFGNGALQTIDDSTEGALDLPFADEIIGAAGAPLYAIGKKVIEGEWAPPDWRDVAAGYTAVREGMKKRRSDAQTRTPVGYGLGKIAGTTAAVAPAVASLPATVPAMMATGAVVGGLSAAGEGEGAKDRVQRGIKGALVGTATGAAAGGAGALIRPSNAATVAKGLRHASRGFGLSHIPLAVLTHGASALKTVPLHAAAKGAAWLAKNRAARHAAGTLVDPKTSGLSKTGLAALLNLWEE